MQLIMIKFLNFENIIDAIKRNLNVFFDEKKVENTTLPDNKYINEFSKSENSIKIVFDIANFKILNVSDNIETLTGHSVEEVRKVNMRFVFGLITLEHLLFPFVWSKWITDIYNQTGNLDDLKIACFGIKIKHKKGHTMRILIRYAPLEILNNRKDGISSIAIMSIEDITHLMKSDAYWFRAEFGLTEKQTHHLFSDDKKNHQQDIISSREKDVVRLIAQGMESKEIGEVLFISPNTVDNHRRNMIARTGVRDTTALVQICRMVGII